MADSMFNEISEKEKQQYMHASSSEVVIATVTFSVLMTLLVLNIVFYLACKYVSRQRTNQNLDAKQVKRIKVKLASQITKDFEKESIQQLMNQLRSSSRRNSEVEIQDSVYNEDTINMNILKKSTTQEELSVTIELSNHSANIQRITLGNHDDEVCQVVPENVSEQKVQMDKDNSCTDDKNNLTKKVRNNVIKRGNSSNNNPNMRDNLKFKNKNMNGEILKTNSNFTVDNSKNYAIEETTKNKLTNLREYENGGNLNERRNNVSLEDYSHNGDIKPTGTPPLIGNYGHQSDSLSSNEKDLLPEQNELPSVFISNLSQQTGSMNCLHDNHLKNTVAITITTVDGLQSAMNFGSEMDLTASK